MVLLPVAMLLLGGIVALCRRRDWIAWVVGAGVFVSLIPAAMKGEPAMIQRAMYVLPFIALTAGFGFAALAQSRVRTIRAASILLIFAAPVQFAYFYFDYFNHYKFRSAFYYDPVNFQGVAEYLLARDPAPTYYFTSDVDDASVKWRFYVVQRGRQSLLSRTTYLPPDERPDAAIGSVLVTYQDDVRLAALSAAGWQVEQAIRDVDNRPAAAILRKIR
jgi:hypothetical protein